MGGGVGEEGRDWGGGGGGVFNSTADRYSMKKLFSAKNLHLMLKRNCHYHH